MAKKDSFFITEKRKRKPARKEKEEQPDSDDNDIDNLNLESEKVEEVSEDEMETETPAQKRLRLAKAYLEKVQEEVDDIKEGEIDAKQMDRDLIAERLHKETEESQGRAFYRVADKYATMNPTIKSFTNGKKGHQLSLTSIAVSIQNKDTANPVIYIYTGSKDAMIVKWDFKTGKREHVFDGGLKPTKKLLKSYDAKSIKVIGHNDQVLTVAASSDGKYMVSGGKDKVIYIWSTVDNSLLGRFTQHRDAISSLKFRNGYNQLYSSSYDRSIKVWNVDELSYVETLFGHQDQITSLDCLSRERCISSGSRDRTCRLWKIPEESQLVFRGGGGGIAIHEDLVVMQELLSQTGKKREKDNGLSGGTIDVVAMIDEEHFVSGSDSGAISLWSINRKKPIYTKLKCHGVGSPVRVNEEESVVEEAECPWIVSLAAVPYSDMFVSGSADGYIKLWKLSDTKKSFALLNSIPMVGFINSLAFFEAPESVNAEVQPKASSRAEEIKNKAKLSGIIKSAQKKLYLGVAVGQEHKFGRWWRIKEAKNQCHIITL
ncbi:pre-rRNA processing protein [Boothiomyces macroporosus]|uniref:Pre-rRNA processing protein n=1 Tax=Boothiomyces macroporosus TaxID=261099 RepID=A0AAD5UIL4_9FUNG|nr:pre-rRNA processing protein [Boothiomyces macroporosus]